MLFNNETDQIKKTDISPCKAIDIVPGLRSYILGVEAEGRLVLDNLQETVQLHWYTKYLP